MTVRMGLLGAAVVSIAVLQSGCSSYPQLERRENLAVVMQLRTAIGSRKPELVDRALKKIREQQEAGELGDRAFTTLTAFAEQAKSGDWKAAEASLTAFQKAQAPIAK